MPSCATVAQLGEGQWTRNRTGAAWQPENCEAHIGDPCSALSAPAGSSKFVVMLGDVDRDDVAFLDIWPLTKQVAHAWSLDGTHFADEVKHEENKLVLAALKLMSAKRVSE